MTAVAGLLGTLAGGWLGDKLDRKREGGGLGMSGIGLLLAAPCMYVAVNVESELSTFACIGVAQFLIFLNSGPINAAIVNCVQPAFRAFAMGLNVLCIHMLGDAISPTLIGRIADVASLTTAIEVNAVPVLLGGVALHHRREALPRGRAPAALRPGCPELRPAPPGAGTHRPVCPPRPTAALRPGAAGP